MSSQNIKIHKFYNYLADNYALHGQESDKYFDTRLPVIKDTLQTLQNMGLAVVWVDLHDTSRWMAKAVVVPE